MYVMAKPLHLIQLKMSLSCGATKQLHVLHTWPPLLVGLLRHSQHISNVTAFADSSARAVRDTHNKQSRPLEGLKDLHVDDTLRVLVLGNSIAALCLTWKFPTLIQANPDWTSLWPDNSCAMGAFKNGPWNLEARAICWSLTCCVKLRVH